MDLGRPWLFYWLFPYPNSMNYWPQFRSPLVWMCLRVSTYFTISLVFWFIGLIPDLATLATERRTAGPHHLRNVGYGLARFGAALGSISDC